MNVGGTGAVRRGEAGHLLQVVDLVRTFDISRPLLNRLILREPRQFLTAVDGVSFNIRKGATFGLVGESGSGKSTVARMIVGLLRPTRGRIVFDGLELPALDESRHDRRLRRRLAAIFQNPYASLNPRMTASDIVAEPIRAFRLFGSQREVANRVFELLSLVGLSRRDGAKYPHQFSGGQRQRIAIARALAGSPDLIVCDEPTSALDVSIQAQVLNLMQDLQEELGLTYLLISHNLAVMRQMAELIGVMYLGRLVEAAPAAHLFQTPKHPYSRMLLESVPDITMRRRRPAPAVGEIPNPLDPPSGCAFHPRCPLATARCRVERPELRAVGTALVACHIA